MCSKTYIQSFIAVIHLVFLGLIYWIAYENIQQVREGFLILWGLVTILSGAFYFRVLFYCG